jgi:hypothetical protein
MSTEMGEFNLVAICFVDEETQNAQENIRDLMVFRKGNESIS